MGVIGLCLVTAKPEPEANPGWSSGGYGGVSHGHVGGGYSSSGGSISGHHGGGGHGRYGSYTGAYVSRPSVKSHVVKVVKPVVVHQQPIVSRRVVSSGGYGGVRTGYQPPVASYAGHGW